MRFVAIRAAEPRFPRDKPILAVDVVSLIDDLRKAKGHELLLRRVGTSSAGVTCTRMRKVLGPNFYVHSIAVEGDISEIWARARRAGEPAVRGQKIRLGKTWVTVEQAAEILGITPQWVREHYINGGRVARYKFGPRIVLRRTEIEDVAARTRKVGGAWLSRTEHRPLSSVAGS